MNQGNLDVQSQITFLYYHNLVAAVTFYEKVMGFELIEDQEWARIYRVSGNAYMGIVDESKGYLKAQQENAVLVTLVVGDVAAWRDYLLRCGVTMLTELEEKEDIQVRCFFIEDPGGYTLEIQQFLKPDVARVFQRGSEELLATQSAQSATGGALA